VLFGMRLLSPLKSRPGIGGCRAHFSLEAPESATPLLARAFEWKASFIMDNQGKVSEVRTARKGVESPWRPLR
jgi:hypothetical protein